jgi:hypothetical protein
MQKLMTAAAMIAAMGMLPVSAAMAEDAPARHHHARHHKAYSGDAYVDPAAVRDGYVMNGNFDWRRRGEHRPWYAHGYNDDCVAWSHDAYHYACDPNNRY